MQFPVVALPLEYYPERLNGLDNRNKYNIQSIVIINLDYSAPGSMCLFLDKHTMT